MKTLFNVGIALMVSVIMFSSCDENIDPYKDFIPAPPLGECEGPVAKNDTNYSDTLNPNRKIVLEEYTGVKCQNCPQAATIAKNLLAANPKDMILMAVHASGFAKPNTKYPDDFRTDAGNELYDNFTPAGLPAAMFNRKEVDGNITNLTPISWESTFDKLKADADYAPYLKVKIRNIYNPEVKKLRSSITAKIIRQTSDNILVSGYILEDNIVAPQLDGSNRIADYKHYHVLRSSFPQPNGTGKLLFSNATVNDEVVWDENGGELCTTIDTENWKTEDLEVVFLFFYEGSKEIIHAEKVHLTKN